MYKRIITSLVIALLLVATLALPAVAAGTTGELIAHVTLNSAISISVEDIAPGSGIVFGSLNVGTNNNPDAGINASTPSAIVTVEAGTTVPVDLQISGTDFGGGLTIDNAKYNTSFDPVTAEDMSTTPTTFVTDKDAGSTTSIWHWLDVPASGVTAGVYQSTFTYTAVDST